MGYSASAAVVLLVVVVAAVLLVVCVEFSDWAAKWRDRARMQLAMVRVGDDARLDLRHAADQVVLYDELRAPAAVDAYFTDARMRLRNAFPGDSVRACPRDRDTVLLANGNAFCV